MEAIKENSIHTLFMYVMFSVLKKTVRTNKMNKCVCYKIMKAKCLNKGRVWVRNE